MRQTIRDQSADMVDARCVEFMNDFEFALGLPPLISKSIEPGNF